MNKILIVDDSADLLEPLKFFLEQKNYMVKTLINADHIYQEIHEYKPDLLILDIFLEGEDGREICKVLRKNAETKHLCILLFSASPKILTESKSYYADDYLEKPFDLNTLHQKIQSLLEWAPIRMKAFQFEVSPVTSLYNKKSIKN